MSSNIRLVIHCCRFVLFWRLVTSIACASEVNYTENILEALVSKLEYLEYKLQAMDLGMKERFEELSERHLRTQPRKFLTPQTPFRVSPWREAYLGCHNVPTRASGVFLIQMSEADKPFEALCAQNVFGGGWMVIQHRFDGSLDFCRNRTEYRNGFGDVKKEFWIGLKRLYQWTSLGRCELLVELRDFNGTYKYARYDEFQIGNKMEKYRLQKLGAYSGTAGNAMAFPYRYEFNSENMDYFDHFSKSHSCDGAWWLAKGFDNTNLNGRYSNKPNETTIFWSNDDHQRWAFTKMMIRFNQNQPIPSKPSTF